MNPFPIPDWAEEVDDAQFTDPALIQTRAAKFERTIRRRNVLEYAAGALAGALLALFSLGAALTGEFLIAAASALCAIGLGIILWQLDARASVLPARPEAACLDHLRRQYERQYQALVTVPKWYLAPLLPGILAFYGAVTLRVAQAAGWSAALDGMWWPLGASFGVFGAIALANWWAARALKRQIERIDALGR
jgi:hypothetical protein